MSDLFFANLLAWSAQVALLAAAAWLISRLLPIDSPGVRHAWWRFVLVVCLALPLVQPWRSVFPAPAVAPAEIAHAPIPDGGFEAALSATGQVRAWIGFPSPSWPAVTAAALAAGIALRLAWLAAGFLHLRRLRRAGAPAARSETVDEVAALVGTAAEIRYVEHLAQPVTFGVRRPVVLLPASLRTKPDAVQRAVLAHELWHVRRRDWLWVVAEEVVRGVLWFHPTIWWLVSRVRSSREEVVDELTVLLTNSRRGYLEALLAFADQPSVFPAAPFAVRRHLFERMLLISREAVMSSKRILISCAAMVSVLAGAGWYGVSAFPLVSPAPPAPAGGQQAPPRDPRPQAPRPATSREAELQKIVAETGDTASFFELATLQEGRGATSEAESTLQALRQARPGDRKVLFDIAYWYQSKGYIDKTMAALEEAVATDPSNPNSHQLLATFYEELVRKGDLGPVDRATFIANGIAAADRALALRPDYVEALIYKNLLLRHQAAGETNAARKQAVLAEADMLRNRALELRGTPPSAPPAPTSRQGRGAMPPPPPPPPPPGGKEPVRIGGDIKPPKKIHDVNPVYPAEAQAANVQGVVILEALIDESGNVIWTKVLRSIPMLDEAAQTAVQQWKFTPTQVDGEPVPVLMTTTVNFVMQ